MYLPNYLNKEKLQQELGLAVDKKKFMIAIISRLTDQKGLDLVNYAIERIIDPYTQIVVIGTGDERYENMFKHYRWKYPECVSANILYSDGLARKLYAAADSILVPSLFEPCGLTQLMAFRYGTIPIVRETGGLKDTVEPYDEFRNTGTGFSFANYNAEEISSKILTSLKQEAIRKNEKLNVKVCLDSIKEIEEWVKSFYSGPISLTGASFGGFLLLRYLENNTNQYGKVILRAPALEEYYICKEDTLENWKEMIEGLDKGENYFRDGTK